MLSRRCQGWGRDDGAYTLWWLFTPERHLPTPGQHGHSPLRHTAAGTAAPTTANKGNTVPQRANPTSHARVGDVCVCSERVSCVALPSGGGSSVGPSPLCGSPVGDVLLYRVPVSPGICSSSCLSLALTLSLWWRRGIGRVLTLCALCLGSCCSGKKINRSHTHTHIDRKQHPRHRHTHTHDKGQGLGLG